MNTVLVPGVGWPQYRPSNMTNVRERAKRVAIKRVAIKRVAIKRVAIKAGPTLSSRIRDWVRRFPGKTGRQIAEGLRMGVGPVNRSLRNQLAYGKLRAERKVPSGGGSPSNHYYPI